MNYPYQQEDNGLSRDGRNKRNQNFKDIESDVRSIENISKSAQSNATQAISDSSSAVQKANNALAQVDALVIGSNTSQAETVQARIDDQGNTFSTLKQRIDNESKKISEANTQLAKKATNAVINVKDFGAIGDGLKDDTIAIQAAINSISSGTIIIPNGTFITHDIKIDGKSNINFICYGVLKLIDNCPSDQGILIINNSNNIQIDLILDCNVQNNGVTLKQQSHGLKILGSSNITGNVIVTNICGDGVYIGNGSSGIFLEKLIAKNSTDAGRNGISIINATNVRVKHFESVNVGIATMPGGFDIEPNGTADIIKNVVVDYAYIDTIGTNGFSINNSRLGTLDSFFVNKLVVVKRTGSGTDKYAITIKQVSNVKILDFTVECNNINGGLQILDSTDVSVNGLVQNAVYGYYITNASNININSKIKNIINNAIVFSGTTNNVQLDIDPSNCNTLNSTNTSVGWCIRLESTATVTQLKVSGNLSKRGNTRGIITVPSGGVLTDARFENCDCSGSYNASDVFNRSQDLIRKRNCKGVDLGVSGRPTLLGQADLSFQMFDSTLGKPIFWTGLAWKDSTGVTV